MSKIFKENSTTQHSKKKNKNLAGELTPNKVEEDEVKKDGKLGEGQMCKFEMTIIMM